MLKKNDNQVDNIKRIVGKIRSLRSDIIIHELELECMADHHNIIKLLDKLEWIIFDNYSPK